MKAIVVSKYGAPLEVLHLEEVEKPTPAENQVLVRVEAASINISDLAPIRGLLPARLLGTGLGKPRQTRLGSDLAGQVEAVGPNVTRFRPGDEVFGNGRGSLAEYAIAREDLLTRKPALISFEEAATVGVAATTALQALRKGQIQSGRKVLIHGASGSVGPFAVQIAKSSGAEVTAVCSTKNVENARAIGADQVIDYTREDFTKNGEKYDLIVAVNGYRSIFRYRRALSPKGICIVVGGSLNQISQALLLGPLLSRAGGQQIGFMGIAKLNQADLTFLKELLEGGKIKALIDRVYPFDEAPAAFHYLEEGHARGKIVLIKGKSF